MTFHQKQISRKQANSASYTSNQKRNRKSNGGESVDLIGYLDDRISDNPYSNMPQSALPNVNNTTVGSVGTNKKTYGGSKLSTSVNQSRI